MASTLEQEIEAIRQLKEEVALRQERKRQSTPGIDPLTGKRVSRETGLLAFIRHFWTVLEPVTEFVEGQVLDDMTQHLEAVTLGKITRLMINVSPGSMKSLTTNVFWPAWEWGPMGMPHLRYVSFAYAEGLTTRDNIKFRKLVQSDEYRRLWGSMFELEKEGEVKVTNNKTGSKFASSVTGIGLGERGDRVLLDDPHNVKLSESDTVRHNTINWFRGTITDRLNHPTKSAIIIIMQRVHQMDICGMILADGGWDYTHLMIPMLYEEGRQPQNALKWKDHRTEDGEIAWPERWSPEAIARIQREKSSYDWSGQYQQRPVPRGGGVIKYEHWQPYNAETAADLFGTVFPMYPPSTYTVMAVDTAQTDKKFNDPSAGVLLSVCTDKYGKNQVIMIYAWTEWLEFYELCQKVFEVCSKYRVDKVIIEDKASGHPLIQELRRRMNVFADKISHGKQEFRHHANFSLQLVKPEGDKISRALAVQNLFEAGVVWAPCDEQGMFRSWADKVRDQVADLGRGEHDDLADALVYALKFLRESGIALMPDDHQFAEEDALLYQKPERPMYPAFG